jgi:hypothetical protein
MMIFGWTGLVVIASQRVRPEVVGPMVNSAKQSRSARKSWIASLLSLLAMTSRSIVMH